jgi:serine protease Do
MKRKLYFVPIIVAMLAMMSLDCVSAIPKEKEKKGYLGVTVDELSTRQKKKLNIETGVVVQWIDEESPADKAGLMEDDIILTVNDIKIIKPATLSRVVKKLKPGADAKLELMRDGKKMTMNVEIGKVRYSEAYVHGSHYDNFINIFPPSVQLGVRIEDVGADLAEYFGVKASAGVLVLDVFDDTPAQDAGLKAGDVIIKIDNEATPTVEELKELLAEYEADDELAIEIVRHKQTRTLKATLEKDSGNRIFMRHLPGMRKFEIELPKKFEHDLHDRIGKKNIIIDNSRKHIDQSI